jgi:poly [ADP-ribose] polymerase 6/8
MESILLFTEDAIRESPNHCIICSGKLPHLGLKPTVCDSPLCVFSHEQYGLGVDLESMILKSPEIVDLLITMCYAACSQQQLGYHRSNFNPFDPFPRGLEIKVKNEKTGQIDVLSFMKGDDRDNKSVSEVLNLIPTIEQLTCWVIDGKLKDHCDELHMLMYPLLRWIMASNRSHLKKLEKHEQISEMQTEHQYLMMSSPPEKEKRFQELKRKYGSVYAFHGSALRNWHSILRVGLKNMSGTAGQMNGAAFGSGVYLAPHSSTSAGYMQFFQGWPKSTLFSKNLGCMAVCEIITKKDEVKQPKPHYVIPNEELIQARYFMIYDARCAANADGGKLRPPDIDWA